MITKANKRMKRLLSTLGSTGVDLELDQSLAAVLADGFVNRDGSVFLGSQKKLSKSVRQADFGDATGYECFVNHVHIDDYVPEAETKAVREQGLEFARKLAENLSSSFPGKPFLVILACSDSGSSVRFHIMRQGQKWLSDDLEGYAQEAILAIETQ